MGTNVEWSHVALFVAAMTVGVVCLELFIELVGVKNNPRESLVFLRHGVLFSLLFGMIHVFQDRLLHGALLLFVIGVALAIVASGIVNRRFSRLSKAS
jgi:inner membrane protein involved in colicin E2 resistance